MLLVSMENLHTHSVVSQTYQALMWKILSNEVFAVTSYFTCPFTRTPAQYWDSTHTLLGTCHTFRILRPSLNKGHVSGSLQYQMRMQSPPLETTASTLTSQFSGGLPTCMSNHINWTGRNFLHSLPHVVESVRSEEFLSWGSKPDQPYRFSHLHSGLQHPLASVLCHQLSNPAFWPTFDNPLLCV